MALTGSTDEQKIWNFLFGKLNNAYGVAGLMGNLYAESGLSSTNLQNTYEKSLGYTDSTYTAAVDDKTYTNFIYDSAGYGLAQWTYWSRKKGLYEYITNNSYSSIGSLEGQLNYLYKELSESYSSVLTTLKNATDVTTASTAVLTQYERPSNTGSTVQATRASYGQKYYDKYAASSSSSSSSSTTSTSTVTAITYPTCPFTVKVLVSDLNIYSTAASTGTVKGTTGKGTFTITKVTNNYGYLKSGAGYIYLVDSDKVTIGSTVANSTTTTTASTSSSYRVKVTASALNIRSGPGTNYAVVGTITDKGVYTITEESNGFGKLKSGAGWISLSYVKEI